MIPRRRRLALSDVGIPDDPERIGHFVFDSWISETTREAWVECSVCKSRTACDPFHSLGYPCSFCVERYGAYKRAVLLPPAIVGDVAQSLDRWSKVLRQAVEAGEITVEEASKAWSQYEYEDE
jgi:hypothetical protein